jgi:hypothetical protein
MDEQAGHIDAIEDNYPEYELDQLGYHYDAWELTLPADVVAHDRIRLMDDEALARYVPSSDLERLGLLHVVLRRGDEARAEALAAELVSGERKLAAIAYEDLGLWRAKRMARRGEVEAGLEALEAMFGWEPQQQTPEESRERLRGEVLLAGGRVEEAEERFGRSLGPEDAPLAAERAYEIAALWASAEDVARAQAWCAKCEACAARSKNRAVLVDVALLRERMG